MGTAPTNTATMAHDPVASPPIHAQDSGPIATLPPTYDQLRGTPVTSPPMVGSPVPQGQQYPPQQQQQYFQQQQQHGTPVNSPPIVGSPAPQGQYYPPQQQQQQQQGVTYLSNPSHNGNSMPKHEPQLPQGGQQQAQPGMVAAVVPLEHLDNNPQWIDCPWCQRRTHTRVEKEGSSMQILTGVVLCLLCVCLACLPCIAGWFEDTHQFCSNCGKKVSTRSHEGHLQVFRPGAMHAVPSQFPAGQQQQQQQAQQQGNAKVA